MLGLTHPAAGGHSPDRSGDQNAAAPKSRIWFELLAPDGKIVNVSPHFAKLLNTERLDLLGRSIFDHVCGSQWLRQFLRTADAGDNTNMVIDLQLKRAAHSLLALTCVATVQIANGTAAVRVEEYAPDRSNLLSEFDFDVGGWAQLLNSEGAWAYWAQDCITGTAVTSRALYDIVGYDIVDIDLGGDTWMELVHRDDLEQVPELALAYDASARRSAVSEYRVRHRAGHWVWVEDRVKIIRDPRSGRPRKLIGVSRDITAQRQLDRVLDTLPAMCCSLDPANRVIHATDSWLAAFSHTRSHVIGRPFVDLLTPQAAIPVKDEILPRLWRQGAVSDEIIHMRAGDGAVRELLLSACRECDANDHPVRALLTMIDVTERRQAETVATRLGRLIEDSRNEVFVCDAETLSFVLVNAGARQNLGYSADELATMTPLDLKPEFDEASFRDMIAPLRSGEVDRLTFSTVHRRKDGSTYDVDVALQYYGNEDPPVFAAIIDDVSERRETEQALRQAQKLEAVGQLAGGMAHDFNNLLTVIKANLQLAALHDDLDDELREHLDAASRASQRGAELVSRLLAFSRRQDLQPEIVDVARVLSETGAILARTLDDGISQHIVADQDLWPIFVDVSQLETALLNLAINARDAMAGGGALHITAHNAPAGDACGLPGRDCVIVRVRDTGAGIDAQLLDKIRQPFFTTKPVGKGSGLGLSMVDGFVRQSGGEMIIDSTVGEGTVIELCFPRADAGAGSPDKRVDEPVSIDLSGRRVLLVEDDSDVAAAVRAMLAPSGCHLTLAANGDEAAGIIAERDAFDLLVSDIAMPGELDGIALADEVKRQAPATQILLVTGHSRKARRRVEASPYPVLAKPFCRNELLAAIGKVMAAAA